MRDGPRWLTDDEQAAWLAYRRMVRRLEARLARDLLRDSGLSTQDYDVLSSLSDTGLGDTGPGDRKSGRRCAKDLATQLLWSPSRLSHHLDRMEGRGLVRREPCVEGRGSDVTLTDAGWAAVRDAAPRHVESVRAAFLDQLSPRDLQVLRRIGETVVAGLEPEPDR